MQELFISCFKCCFGRRLKKHKHEPLNCCEPLVDCCEPLLIPTNEAGPNILIENDQEIKTLDHIQDCQKIEVYNCQQITRIPSNLEAFQWLEELYIKQCNIPTCTTSFPPTLRNLTISYCLMHTFEPACMDIANMATIDLSFNKLERIPNVLESFSGVLSIKGNDIWFMEFSSLPLHRIESADELIIAYKFGLVSTASLKRAIHELNAKKKLQDAKTLETLIETEFQNRTQKTDANTPKLGTASNKQNIHLKSIQDSTKESIKYLTENIQPYTQDVDELLNDAIKSLKCNKKEAQRIRSFKKHSKHPQYSVTTIEVFSRVYTIARSHPHAEAIFEILKEEIEDGLKTCFTGLVSRIVGSLNGFVEYIKINISNREEMLNTIVALRRKYGMLYGNTDAYINELTPVVWQMLEDHCIPEGDHREWLSYL